MDRYYMEDFRAAALRGEIEDFTPLLVNANFTDNANGWQGGSGQGVETGEMYDKQTFDVYQEIEGLPEGSYMKSPYKDSNGLRGMMLARQLGVRRPRRRRLLRMLTVTTVP